MLAEEWLQYIAPFLGPDVTETAVADVFARLLGNRLFMSLGTAISLKDLQPYTSPELGSVLEGIPPEDIAAAIARAHRSAVDAKVAQPEQGEIEFREFMTLIGSSKTKRAGEKEAKATESLLKMQTDYRREIEQSAEKDLRIAELEAEVRVNRRFRSTSVGYGAERLGARVREGKRWIGQHRLRVAIVVVSLILAVVAWDRGWLGILGKTLSVGLFVATVLALDPTVIRENLRSLRGRQRSRKDDL